MTQQDVEKAIAITLGPIRPYSRYFANSHLAAKYGKNFAEFHETHQIE